MPYRLRCLVVMVSVLGLMGSFVSAEDLSYSSWRNSRFLFVENSAPGIGGNYEVFCDLDKDAAGCCGMKNGALCGAACQGDGGCPAAPAKKTALDYGSLHKYLGYTTVLLVGLTAATAGDNGAHYGAAYGTALAAAGTVVTGYLEYGDRLDLSYGLLWKDNAHIILGTIGAAACIAAVALADSRGGGGHAGAGVAGGAAMALSIITIRW